MTDETNLHWLVRPSTIRKLWIGASVVLAFVVLAQTVIYVKGYFGFDAWFGFGAIYGFVSCLIMVLVAKLLGLLLKRLRIIMMMSIHNHHNRQNKKSLLN